MIKSKTMLEVKVGERMFELFLASDSPLGEVHDALMQMKGYIVDRMISAQKAEQEACDKQKQIDEQELAAPKE